MHESRIENGMIGDGDGLPPPICHRCAVVLDDCECDDDADYRNWREEEEEYGGEG